MRLCLAAGALLLLMGAVRGSDVRRVSAGETFQLVSTFLAGDDSDEAGARQVESLQLSEQLSGDVVQILKGEGAGPLTVRALDEQRARSAGLPAPAQPVAVIDAGIDEDQQKALLARITAYALGYVDALPNMSCTETTRYSSSGRVSGIRGSRKPQARLPDGWRLEDTVVEDLNYTEGMEDYHTRTLNGVPNTRPITEIRGAYSRGEFGTILAITFGPYSQARFEWDHWESLQGRRVAVFRYSVEQARSQYSVCCVATGSVTVNGVKRQQFKHWVSAYQGFVYADPDSGNIVQFTFRNVDIPAEYNLRDSRNLVEYAEVTLGGRSFLLPTRAIHFTRSGDGRTRDEIQFSDYRKFGADSTIQFPTDQK
jgi:hypothetical protein